MKKLIALVAMAAVTLCLNVGCGGSSTTSAPKGGTTAKSGTATEMKETKADTKPADAPK